MVTPTNDDSERFRGFGKSQTAAVPCFGLQEESGFPLLLQRAPQLGCDMTQHPKPAKPKLRDSNFTYLETVPLTRLEGSGGLGGLGLGA